MSDVRSQMLEARSQMSEVRCPPCFLAKARTGVLCRSLCWLLGPGPCKIAVLWVMLLAIVVLAPGCGVHGQGETAAEGHIRHKRVLNTAAQQLANDMDTVFLFDEPSRLSELRVR